MSEAITPTDPNALLFPAFMYGDKTTCRRKMKAEAKKWAKRYLEGREFPEPKLVPIPPGSVVFTDETVANFVGGGYSFSPDRKGVIVGADPKQQGLHLQWRAYMMEKLHFEAEFAANLDGPECSPFRSVFVPFLCRTPWGSVSSAALPCLLNSIELTVPRIEGVLRFWEALDTLKYIDFDERPISLAQFMINRFQGAVAMWVDRPTGNLRTNLQTAIDHMRQASEEEIRVRLLERLRKHADVKKELQHREWLKSPGVIEMGVEERQKTGRDWYDDLTSGQLSEHGGFLMWLERNFGPAAQ